MNNFDYNKPQIHADFMPDFIAGYESASEKLKSFSFQQVRDELNGIYPAGYKPSSMAAYFYAKGEYAALADSQ